MAFSSQCANKIKVVYTEDLTHPIVGADGLIPTSTASSLPADSRPTVPGGFIPATPSSYRCTYSVASSAASSSPA